MPVSMSAPSPLVKASLAIRRACSTLRLPLNS